MARKKQIKEPAYFLSDTNMQTINYRVYYMSLFEKIVYFLIAFLVGAAVGYLFYGGIGKNEFGEATSLTHKLDIIISSITGFVTVYLFLPAREESIKNKRKKQLKLQFREMLDSLATSINSGKTVVDSFRDAYKDMQVLYTEDSYIVKELEVILTGLQNNINIEVMLTDLGKRSGIDDIHSFANVFETCYRKGGNIKDVIKNTHQIITEKMEVEQQIETILTSNKTEQKIMMVMPVVLIGMIKSMSPEMANNFSTPSGIISSTVAVVMFVISYFVGKAVLNIKI